MTNKCNTNSNFKTTRAIDEALAMDGYTPTEIDNYHNKLHAERLRINAVDSYENLALAELLDMLIDKAFPTPIDDLKIDTLFGGTHEHS